MAYVVFRRRRVLNLLPLGEVFASEFVWMHSMLVVPLFHYYNLRDNDVSRKKRNVICCIGVAFCKVRS